MEPNEEKSSSQNVRMRPVRIRAFNLALQGLLPRGERSRRNPASRSSNPKSDVNGIDKVSSKSTVSSCERGQNLSLKNAPTHQKSDQDHRRVQIDGNRSEPPSIAQPTSGVSNVRMTRDNSCAQSGVSNVRMTQDNSCAQSGVHRQVICRSPTSSSGVSMSGSSISSADTEIDCLPERRSTVNVQLPEMDLGIWDEAFETPVKDIDSEITQKSSPWPVEQINAISKLVDDINRQRGASPNHGVEICAVINAILDRNMPGVRCKLYGSYHSGFPVENSDINMGFRAENNCVTTKFLNEFQKILAKERRDYFVSFESSRNVKEMYITAIESESGVYCRIKYLDNNIDLQTSDLLQKLCNIDTRVRMLIIALRHWAEVCNIHEFGRNGLHTLAFALMVIHFLQQTEPPVLPIVTVTERQDGTLSHCLKRFRTTNTVAVGVLWLSMFEYYSAFNWRDHVVSITSSDLIYKETTAWNKCWIGIQAPLKPKQNLAKSITSPDVGQFIQTCFEQTWQYFSKPTRFCPKQLSEDEDKDVVKRFDCNEISEYNYCFDQSNFTDGIDLPSFCQECEELGSVCDECAAEEVEVLPPLPAMTDEFKTCVNGALEKAFEVHMLTDEDVAKRVKIVKNIENYIQEKFPTARVKLMGSTLNGFGFQKSDLDICLTFQGSAIGDIDVIARIKQLRTHLRKSREFSSVLAVFAAQIPLVQFILRDSNLRGDISLYNLLACRNTELLCTYSIIDKRVRLLGCAMKLLAKNAGIANTAEHSLSSYSYILMVIHFLQRTNPPVLPALQELPNVGNKVNIVEGWDTWFAEVVDNLVWEHEENKQSAAELLLEMLKYYTEDLDSIITVRSSKKKTMKLDSTIRTARLFNIEDPFILSKNLGAKMSESMSIKTSRTFLRARKLLSKPITHVPTGFKDFKEYFFDPMNLTDGRITTYVECDLCGKLGHKSDKCVRYNFNFGRGRPYAGRGGYYNNGYRTNYTPNANSQKRV